MTRRKGRRSRVAEGFEAEASRRREAMSQPQAQA